MRRAVPAAAAAVLLAGPTIIAFWSGGYYTEPRLIAAIVAWLLVLALALTGPAPLPRGAAGRAALGGLVLLCAWSALSVTWAPLRGPATESVERLLLYAGALVVAIGALRTPAALRAVEPALAAGATIVIGYGLAGRLLPGIVELDRSRSAGGRLEQPITYWNAEGALAAIGLVLCARIAGDRSRPPTLRAAAAAAVVPLGAGVYLSYSRGAIAAAVVGLAILVAAAPSRAQLRAAALALAAGVAAAGCAAAFGGVAALEGTSSQRSRDGAIVLVLLALIAAAAAVATTRRGARDEPRRRAPDAPARRGRRRSRRGSRGRPGGRRARRAAERGGAGRGRERRPAHHRRLEPLRVLARRPGRVRARAADRHRRRRASASSGCASVRSPRPCATRTRSRWRSRRSWGSSASPRSR